jgi:TIR domain
VQVFLSYRRNDVGGYAGRLTDALLQRLGAKSVFQDVIAIAPGKDFTVELDRALDDSDAVLAVIGPGWLTAATPQGAPRLFEADDYVRLELARALNRNVRVVPVLVGGAALPAAIDLPDELRGLVHRQAVVLHDETWHQDVDGLVGSLRGEPAVPPGHGRWSPRRRVLIAAAAGLLVAGGVGAALLLLPSGGSGGRSPPGGSGAQSSPGGSDAQSSPGEGSYTAAAPWRLRIDGTDYAHVGCTVTLTAGDSGIPTQVADRVYGITRVQISQTGSFRWQSTDRRCLITPLAGTGSAVLPFTQSDDGDTDAFSAPATGVTVQVKDYQGGSKCVFRLFDAANGQELDTATATPGTDTVTLNPEGRSKVYLYDDICVVRVSAHP